MSGFIEKIFAKPSVQNISALQPTDNRHAKKENDVVLFNGQETFKDEYSYTLSCITDIEQIIESTTGTRIS